MEVIKNPASWTRKFNCTGAGNGNGGCEATLLVSQTDLYQTSRSYPGPPFGSGETTYHTTFCCPLCAVETDIDVRYVEFLLGSRPTKEEKKEIIKKARQGKVAK